MAELKIIETAEPDHEVAAKLKKDFEEQIKPVLALLERAAKHRMHINFAVGINQFGQGVVQTLDISRHF